MDTKEEGFVKRAKIKIDHNQPYGAVLGRYMKRERWSGADLARQVGCTRNHISEILAGKCEPSFSLGRKICSVFGCELGWRKIPAIPKTPRKKKESTLEGESKGEEAVEAVEVAPVSENGTSAKEKIKTLNELSGKVKASKKETGDE
jgi:transcriptional regulator with XRE-family HTH domain